MMASKNLEESKARPLEDRCLLVTFMQPPPVGSKDEEKVRDRLQIYFQKKRIGGGDVDKVLYPLQGHSDKAIIVFSADSIADIPNFSKSRHKVEIRNGDELHITTDILPKMFQEVQVVINDFYWPLFPRDKPDELARLLQTNGNAILQTSTNSSAIQTPVIRITDSKYLDHVRDVIAEVAGLQSKDANLNKHESKDSPRIIPQMVDSHSPISTAPKSDVSVRPKIHVANHMTNTSTERSARSKLRTSNDMSNHRDRSAAGAEQMTRQDNSNDTLHAALNTQKKREPSRESQQVGVGMPRNSHMIAANFGTQAHSKYKFSPTQHSMDTKNDNGSDAHDVGSGNENHDGEVECKGPFSACALYYHYLEEKCQKEMKEIREICGVRVEFTQDKQYGQGYVMIRKDDNLPMKESSTDLDKAEEEFISLYQTQFQDIDIKTIPCKGVRPERISYAKRTISTEQPSVLVEDSIDEEITFVGMEQEITDAIRTFQNVIGQLPKPRRLKKVTESTSSLGDIAEGVHYKKQFTSAGWKSTTDIKRCKTNEDVHVIVRKDDITKQVVDVIVNAASPQLEHYSGVAGAIRRAAGQELQDACNQMRRTQGECPETKCVHTQGYKLDCKFVVHAVGPTYEKYINKEEVFFTKLQETFSNCFSEANSLGAKTIAIPLISSGAFGGPKDLCAKVLVGSIKRYSRLKVNRTIDEIILVNTDDEACDAISTALNWLHNDEQMETSSGMESGGTPNSHFWKEKVTGSDESTRVQHSQGSKWPISAQATTSGNSLQRVHSSFNNGNVQIIVGEEDIFEIAKTAQCIVIPTDKMLQHTGRLSYDVAKAAGPTLRNDCQKLVDEKTNGFGFQVGDVVHTSGFSLLPGAITFVIAPNEDFEPNRQKLYNQVEEIVRECLQYVDQRLRVQSVAFPLFTSNVHLMELYSEAFAAAMHQWTGRSPENIQQIFVVSTDKSNLALQCAFQEELKQANPADGAVMSSNGARANLQNVGAISADPDLDAKVSGHGRFESQGSVSKDTLDKDSENDEIKDNESDEEDKRCPICLEDFSNSMPAVNLDKCKHKFCQGCLDETMKRKPVCPVCGIVYGVMKGNQPHGQMSVSVSTYGSLPGHGNCGVITINYSFHSGKQGPDHPEPGRSYSGTHRTAYLPNNAEGKNVLALLRRAFDAGLIFTIGTSVTSGATNVVTWNDIHHKTSLTGGPQCFGYPDPTYLRRVTEELAAKGIK